MSAERDRYIDQISEQIEFAKVPDVNPAGFDPVNLDPDNQNQDVIEPEQTPQSIVDNTKTQVQEKVNDALSRIEQVPTPGTLATPFGILILLWLILIPYNGKPRIAWLWLALTGNAVIIGESKAQATGTSIQFSSYLPTGIGTQTPNPLGTSPTQTPTVPNPTGLITGTTITPPDIPTALQPLKMNYSAMLSSGSYE